MIPKSIKILIDRVSFETSWALYSKEFPGESREPMLKILRVADLTPRQDILGCVDALQVEQLKQLPKIYRAIMISLQKKLRKTIEIYFIREEKNMGENLN